jgi:hypothetical protein
VSGCEFKGPNAIATEFLNSCRDATNGLTCSAVALNSEFIEQPCCKSKPSAKHTSVVDNGK